MLQFSNKAVNIFNWCSELQKIFGNVHTGMYVYREKVYTVTNFGTFLNKFLTAYWFSVVAKSWIFQIFVHGGMLFVELENYAHTFWKNKEKCWMIMYI